MSQQPQPPTMSQQSQPPPTSQPSVTVLSPPTPPSGSGHSTPSEIPGTPTSSLSTLSTTAIKDGHRGHPFHPGFPFPAPRPQSTSTLEAERADRISRLTGLTSLGSAGGGRDNAAHAPRVMSTVGSASATGSAPRTTDGGDVDMDRDIYDEEQESLAGTGGYDSESWSAAGSATPAPGTWTQAPPQAQHAPAAAAAAPQGVAQGGVAHGGEGGRVGAEAAERIVRRLDGEEGAAPGGGRALGSPEGEGLGRFYFEERKG